VYAIIQARGRQLKVTPAPLSSGRNARRDRVGIHVRSGAARREGRRRLLAGAPFVADAKVIGVVDGEARGPKLRVFKKKRRKGFRKTRGHRSIFTRVRITEIQA
jgi:large subunit ribosomal protein L21